MDAITLRQLKALWKLKLRLLERFWHQRDTMYRWTMLFSLFFSTLVALVMGAGIGWLVYSLIPIGKDPGVGPQMIQMLWLGLFLTVSVVWVISPLLFVIKNESLTLDVSRLTRYPIAYRTLHGFHTLLSLLDPWTIFYYPMLLALLVAVGVQGGWGVLPGMSALLLLWVLVHTAWSRLFQDLITVVFTSRSLREVLSLIVIVMVILFAFIPALITERTSVEALAHIKAPTLELFLYQWPTWRAMQPLFNFLLNATPAGSFVQALSGLIYDQPRWWLEGCISLLGWLLIANISGIALLRRLFSEPPAQSRSTVSRTPILANWRLPGLAYDMRVMVLKELRVYFRSLLGKLSFFLTPLLVVILRLVGLGASGSYAPASLLLGMTVYVFMTSLFLYINYFGPDGEGFKLYLLSGMPERRVIQAKNLALGLFASSEFAIVLVLYIALYRQPDLDTILFGIGAFIALLMGVLSMGNLLSMRFAGFMDLNQTQYRQSNGTPILMALQVLSMLAGVLGFALWIAHRSHEPLWLVGLTLGGLMSLAWWLLLPFSASLLNTQRWVILDEVTKKE